MFIHSIKKKQFSDLLNLIYGVFHPLKNFVNKKEFISILKKNSFKNYFFPYPVFFGLSKNDYGRIKNKKEIFLSFKKKKLCKISIKKFFQIEKKLFGKIIFGKNFKKHPYYLNFQNDNHIFMYFEIKKIYKSNLKDKNFISPKHFKKKIKKIKKNKFLAGFHTRNVPHKAHQWIHKKMLKNYGSILVQPLLGQYKTKEYKDSIIVKTNKLALENYNNTEAFYAPFFSYPRYAGPREAGLHAIVRRNFGCTHFWVGRDHAGYKNFFKIYESQFFCKKNEKKIKIKIISEKEPLLCKGCNEIKNSFCKYLECKNKKKVKISGTKIRKLIMQKKNIPEYLMDSNISKQVSIKSILE